MPGYTVRHQCDPPEPDGYLPDGTPVYFKFARGSSKSTLQFRIYAKLCFGLSDEEIDELERQAEENLGLASDEDNA